MKNHKCDVCHENIGFISWNFNDKINLNGKTTIFVCSECDKSVQEQAFVIMGELKVPEPHILKMFVPLSSNTYQVGLFLKIPNDIKVGCVKK